MKWTKRLKWLRISKVVIPIALAVSLIFAGFSVYGNEAQNFVITAGSDTDVKLSLTLNRDLTEQTSRLIVPGGGGYKDVTYTPDKNILYNPDIYSQYLPDDIAKQEGMHSVMWGVDVAFYSFSFWLVNNSSRSVDVDVTMTIDSVDSIPNDYNYHIDDAMRVMLVEGEPLLSDETYTVYKKAEKNEENQKRLDDNIEYSGVVNFETEENERYIFNKTGERGITDFAPGETRKYTVVIWLEGWDAECVDAILGERLRMSMDFKGY